MKKLFLFLSFISLMSIHCIAHAICPFSNTYNFSGGHNFENIQILNISPWTSGDGDKEIEAKITDNPSWLGAYVYYAKFVIEDTHCSSDPDENKSRKTYIKVGYSDDMYCNIVITDGTIISPSISVTNCTGGIGFYPYKVYPSVPPDLVASTTTVSNGIMKREYYISLALIEHIPPPGMTVGGG